MILEPIYNQEIAKVLNLKEHQVSTTQDMLDEWATVPFISRYRQERTWWLDETVIRAIIELRKWLEQLFKLKNTALQGIFDQWKLTPELERNIVNSNNIKEVEELYKPYKTKKKTLAMLAIEKGFQIVADNFKKNISKIPDNFLAKYDSTEILEGASQIISAEISANMNLRHALRDDLQWYGILISKIKTPTALAKLNKKDAGQVSKFDIYTDFSNRINYLKPYQILALNRGENLWILNIKIEKTEKTYDIIKKRYAGELEISSQFITELEEWLKLGYTTLFKSVENEIRWILTEQWEDDAIITFSKNLGQLLMTKPEYWKTILALDPGFAAWCKMVVLDNLWNPLYFSKIFLSQKDNSKIELSKIIKNYNIDVIVIGNGTGVKESTELVQSISDIDIYIVNESGASVYSASAIAAEEFPNLGSLERWTVSIWRRFIDPLSELVKIPVWSIGVWMYQHDISEKKLEEKLWYVIEDTVNEVGINVNTASVYVLSHISWITKTAAKKIYNNRPYTSRAELKKQLSPKVFKLAIWFLRVPQSKEILDTTDIHPEQYALARFVTKQQNTIESLDSFYKNNEVKIKDLYNDANIQTLEFITHSLSQAGIEKRVLSSHQKATTLSNSDFKAWDIVPWIIRNVLAFWAFVDIGMKQDGLVHISQIADRYVADPKEVVEVWQNIRVKILSIDESTGKIQLSLKDAVSL